MEYSSWVIKNIGQTVSGFSINNRLLMKKSEFQLIEIVDSSSFGRTLLLDGIPQSSELDEFIYHEALVHSAMCLHPCPQNILIIGGGEGAVLREIVKYDSVSSITMVDIDQELVGLCKDYLPNWHRGSFEDPRVKLIFDDARNFITQQNEKFDCVIIDLTDPFEGGPSEKLFTTEFYRLIQKSLKDENSIVSLQTEGGNLGNISLHLSIMKTLSNSFAKVYPFYAYIPLFSIPHGFALCGNNICISDFSPNKIDNILLQRHIQDLRFFDGQTFIGLFNIPKYLRLLMP